MNYLNGLMISFENEPRGSFFKYHYLLSVSNETYFMVRLSKEHLTGETMPDCLLEKRKQLILEQAAIVISENGFYRATIEEIARRVKLGKGDCLSL